MADQTTPVGPLEGEAKAIEYGPSYYRNYWGGGGPYERNERWLKFFDAVAEGIVRDLHPTSVLDAGCAMGFLVEALRRRGVEAWGIDISEYAITEVDESVREHCSVASLTDPLPRRYDLITCVEVIEHIPPAEAGKAIANLCAATDRILLSTTPQDYGEPTHLNVQPPEAWSALLAEEGFVRDVERDASYLSPWAAVYIRVEEPFAETVRRYDRSWSHLHREVAEVRASLLATQEKLALLEKAESRPLRDELDRRNEEILRLRDLLVGKDAELGALKGRVAELEDQSQRIANVLARLRVPGVVRLAIAGLRGMLGRRG
jgi:2-polyprenyl-3-methyl-5-hydroxy-6-metoxy-1,4-benzoquinol methylase